MSVAAVAAKRSGMPRTRGLLASTEEVYGRGLAVLEPLGDAKLASSCPAALTA